jgi:hypothetical protein
MISQGLKNTFKQTYWQTHKIIMQFGSKEHFGSIISDSKISKHKKMLLKEYGNLENFYRNI